MQWARDHCSLLVAGSCHSNCHFGEAFLVAGSAPHSRKCSFGVGMDAGKTCLKNEGTVVDCTAGGELHAAGLPPPSSSLLQRSRPSQIIAFCICFCWEEEEEFDATGIDNGISFEVLRRVTRWGSFDLEGSVQANTFALVDQYEKVLPCTDVAFAGYYSPATCWRISRCFRSCGRCRMAQRA